MIFVMDNSSGDGMSSRRRRALIVGAFAMAMGGVRSAAFRSAWGERLASGKSPPLSRAFIGTRGRPFGPSIHSQSTALWQGATTTGWINSGTIDFHETIHSDFNGTDRGSTVGDDDNDAKLRYPSPSSVERLLVRDRLVYVKRDDALHLPSSNICGNKARKFLSLNSLPAADFPDAIVSYGGPQSNAMVALAAIVSSKNAEIAGSGQSSDQDIREPSLEGNQVGSSDVFWQLDMSAEGGNRGQRGHEMDRKVSPEGKSSPSSDATSTKSLEKRFIYYTKTMPRYLRKNPSGNFLRALALGMELRTMPHDEYDRLFGGLQGGSVMAPADLDPPVPGRSLWIPQGGACSIAQPGSDVLAKEIVDYWLLNGKGMPLAVCVPGGTCTSSLLLHRSIKGILEQRQKSGEEATDICVVVIPCVGDDGYAMRQMMSLDRSVGGKGRPQDMPRILKPRVDVEYGSSRKRTKGYFTFGEPAAAILQTYDEMNKSGLFLDLLYGAPSWSLLLQHWRSRDPDCPIAGRQIMYVHSGGLEGIASQLTRYKHKGLLDARTIQTRAVYPSELLK